MPANPFSTGASVRVDADTSSFNDAIGGATSSLSSFKKQVGLAGAALGALATGALAAATNQARSFDEAIIELSKRVGKDQANEMREGISEMAEEIPLTREEIAGLADDAARFGIEGEEAILQFTETVAKMGEATTLATDEAGKSMAKLAELTNTPVDEIENLGSSINSLSNNFATSSQEIVDSMLRSSAALSQLGLNQKEIAGLSAAINEVSESSRRAGTRLRRVAQQMMNPKKVGDIAEALGMTADEFKSLRDENPRKALMLMAEAMAEGEEGADKLRTSLSTASRQALAGFAQNLDGTNQALEMSNKTFSEASSLQREFDREMAKTSSSIAIATSKLKGIAIEIGNNVLPIFNRFLRKVVIPAIDRFSKLNEQMGGMPATIGLVVTAVVGFTAAGAALVSMVGGMSAILGAASAALAGLGTALTILTGPIGIAIAAVAALAFAWKKNVGDIQGKTKKAFDFIKNKIKTVLKFIQVNLIKPTLNSIRSLWNEHGKAITKETKDAFNTIKNRIKQVLKFVLNSIIKPTLNLIQGFWNNHGEQLIKYTKLAFNTIKGVIETIIDGVLTSIRVVLNLIQGDWKKAWNLVKTFTKDLLKGIVSWIKTTGKNLFKTAWGIVIGVVKDIWNGFVKWLFGNSLIQDLFSDISKWLKSTGKDIMSSAFGAVTGTITSAFKSAKNTVSNLVSSIIKKAKKAAKKAGNIGDDGDDEDDGDDGDDEDEDDGDNGKDPIRGRGRGGGDDDDDDDDEGGGGCFVAGEKVLTVNGYTPIEDLTEGQEVVSFDGDKYTTSTIGETITHDKSEHDYDESPLLQIEVKGKTTQVTSNHRFLDADGNWRAIGNIREGERIKTKDGATKLTEKITLYRQPEKIYNLHMETGPNNYVVNGAVVHNIKMGPRLATGGLVDKTGMALIHAGERVLPEAQVSERGGIEAGTTVNIENINASGRAEGKQAAKALRSELKSQGF